MKCTKLFSFLSAAMVAALLTGCGSPAATSSKTDSDTAAQASTSSVAAGSSSVVSKTVEPTSSITAAKPDYATVTKQLMSSLDTVDRMGCGGISFDATITTMKGDRSYAKVTDKRFSSTSDIKKFMQSALTDKMIAARYVRILDTETPRFIDNSSGLFERSDAFGGGFTWGNDAPSISDITATSFTAKVKYDDYGALSTMTLKIVLDNTTWKIDSLII